MVNSRACANFNDYRHTYHLYEHNYQLPRRFGFKINVIICHTQNIYYSRHSTVVFQSLTLSVFGQKALADDQSFKRVIISKGIQFKIHIFTESVNTHNGPYL